MRRRVRTGACCSAVALLATAMEAANVPPLPRQPAMTESRTYIGIQTRSHPISRNLPGVNIVARSSADVVSKSVLEQRTLKRRRYSSARSQPEGDLRHHHPSHDSKAGASRPSDAQIAQNLEHLQDLKRLVEAERHQHEPQQHHQHQQHHSIHHSVHHRDNHRHPQHHSTEANGQHHATSSHPTSSSVPTSSPSSSSSSAADEKKAAAAGLKTVTSFMRKMNPQVDWRKVIDVLPQLDKNWLKRVMRSEDKKKLNTLALPAVPEPPKYPLVLCHGLGGDKPLLTYFMDVPEDLTSLGIKVFTPKVPRYGSVYKRAEVLREQVLKVMATTGAPKANLIGHSMGGLDARYFITHLGGHELTASLITLGTPHHGSAYADVILKATTVIGLEKLFAAKVLPFDMEGHHHVTRKFLKEVFNPQTPDHPDVRYFSYGGSKRVSWLHPLFITQQIVSKYEGAENDGLVSIESSKWGTYLGTLDVDHAAMINWSASYDARAIYRRLANFLREQGF